MLSLRTSIFFIFLIFFSLISKGNNKDVYKKLLEYTRRNPSKSIELINQKKQALSTLQYSYLIASANQNIGNYSKADSIIESVFQSTLIKADSSLYIDFLILDADNKKILDRFESALNSLLKIEDYYKSKNNITGQLETSLLFAEYYRAADNYELALKYINRANSTGNQIKGGFPLEFKARMLNRKAAIYLEQAIYLDSVELFSKEVIEIARKTNDFNQVATASNELGFLYLNINNKDAEKYFKTAIKIWEEMGYGIYANNARENLARWYLKSNRNKEVIQLCNESLMIVKKFNWTWEEGYWNEILATSYYNLGDYKKSYEYLVLSKNQLLNNSRNQYKDKIAYYANRLQLKERQEELNQKNYEIKSKSRENNILFLGLLTISILLIAVTIGLLIINKQKKLLIEQKNKIDQINKNLEKLINQKEILLKEVNHRVKNNLSLLSGLMYLKNLKIENPEANEAIQELQSNVQTISLIHESLYQRDDFEKVNFQDYLLKLGSHIIGIYPNNKKIALNIYCEELNPDLQLAIPIAMMINELIINSIKYAFNTVEFPSISIKFDRNLNQLLYFDNGPKFEIGYSNNSIGGNLLNIFSEQIGAEIKYENITSYTTTIISFSNKV